MLKRFALLLILFFAASLLVVSCAPDAPDTPAVDDEPTDALSEKHGGTLRSAYYAPTNMDPAFFGTVADDWIGKQWGDFLV